MLPDVPIPTEKVETAGGPVLVRGLSAAEAVLVGKIVDSGDIAGAEITIIAYATDTPKPDVKRWYGATPRGVIDEIVDVCHRLSGMDEEASKSVEAGTVER